MRLFCPVRVENDLAWVAIPFFATAEAIGEVVVVFPRDDALAGRVDVVPVFHVVRLGAAGWAVVAHCVVTDGVLHVLGGLFIDAVESLAFVQSLLVGLSEAP